MAGTPMFVVKAYLPVNESFGKCLLCKLLLVLHARPGIGLVEPAMPSANSPQPVHLGGGSSPRLWTLSCWIWEADAGV